MKNEIFFRVPRQGTDPVESAFSIQTAQPAPHVKTKGKPMLWWAVTFFIVAIIAAVFGFGGIASASAGIAQILFIIFLVLFVVAMIARAVRGRTP